jgi:trk system potassium uptake protein TrkH
MGTMPYLIDKSIPSKVDVLFETISGFTTTGTSILANIEQLPGSILFWRSLTHWAGGITTIIMTVTVIPSLNFAGNKLFSLESLSGEQPVHDLRFIIIRVFIIYLLLTVAQVLFLFAGGMNLFESLCHSFGTVSTGCFSPKNAGIAPYSKYLQYIMVLFMFLSGMSYLLFYSVITGNFKTVKQDDEIRAYSIIIAFVALFITGVLFTQTGKQFGTAFNEGIFQAVSFASSSGYSNTEYLSWPDYTLPPMYLLLIIGGCVGSASGGIKMSRSLVLFRNFRLQFINPNSNTNISGIKYNGKVINADTNLSILAFISVFGLVIVLGTIVLSIFENDLKRSAFLAISALSTFGQNLNLSDFPNAGKIVLSLMMFLGRLEIFPVLLLLVPSFYRRNSTMVIMNPDEEN